MLSVMGVADLSADVTRRAARFSPARSRVLTGRMTFLMIYKVSALTGQEGAVHYSYGYYIDLNANCYFVLLPSLFCPQQSSVYVTLTIRLLLLNSDFSILQFVHRSVKVRSKAPSHRNSLLYV